MQILKFKSNEKITKTKLIENGFVNIDNYYFYEKYLYDNLIKLIVEYDFKETPVLSYNVTNSANDTYIPFSSQEFDNNIVAKEVINNFNHEMKNLVKKEIVLDDYDKKGGLSIKIKYHADIDRIKQMDKGDWIDLRASETVELKCGEFALIPLGVSMKLPKGYEAWVVPRSSTFKNYGIIQTNSIGIIDGSYCGDNDIWKMPVYAIRDTVINKNDRICQFRIMRNQKPLFFTETDSLGYESRGGFGSTGVK